MTGAQIIEIKEHESDHRFVELGNFNIRSEVLTKSWLAAHDKIRHDLFMYSTRNHVYDEETIFAE